ncbi:MAG: PTS IIA-like nitrogen regulatory protein PtsN [Gammaproteobacteria bacterium]|nr:PTS IIA-like nitrogen regulatory protein PtsN [Pseudomonadales bacterium]MCP5345525.1 PTS IIA-like nitrogen regulatory protein PtsN [Pseudomonadales bacterium]
MQLEDILTPERCYCDVKGVSKKRLLKTISEYTEKNVGYLDANTIFDALMARERLGSTGLGNGIAIPHCKIPQCREVIGCIFTLEEPVDFDSVDSKPVDLLFILIVPDEQSDTHVKILGQVAELFNDENFCFILRNTHNGDDLYSVAITH